jgi:hypothetical protein
MFLRVRIHVSWNEDQQFTGAPFDNCVESQDQRQHLRFLSSSSIPVRPLQAKDRCVVSLASNVTPAIVETHRKTLPIL